MQVKWKEWHGQLTFDIDYDRFSSLYRSNLIVFAGGAGFLPCVMADAKMVALTDDDRFMIK